LRTHTAPEELKKRLEQDNIIISRRRIGRLMKESDLTCKTKRKFKATTNSKHNLPIAPNLLNQNFITALPNQCWVGDISYVPTEEGWLYLATVIDLYSRKIPALVNE
jgi:putative transposase